MRCAAVLIPCSLRFQPHTLSLTLCITWQATQLRIMSLKRIDFNLFLSCIRFPLACYQLVIWLQDKLVLLMEDANSTANVSLLARSQAAAAGVSKTSTSSTAAEEVASRDGLAGCGCLQLQPLSTVELHRVKMCLQKYAVHIYFIVPSPDCVNTWLLVLYREQQFAQNRSASRVPTSSGGSLSQLSKTSSNANTIGANSKADRWRRLRSTSYHMHDCPQPADRDGDSLSHGCGLVFSDSESRTLVQLLVTTVDALVEAGGPNVRQLFFTVSIVSVFSTPDAFFCYALLILQQAVDSGVLVEAFMIRYLKKMNSASGVGSPNKK